MKNLIDKKTVNDALHQLVRQKATVWKILMLFLCVYVLTALFIETVFKLPDDIKELLMDIDNFVCLVFLADFSIKFFSAKNKLKYLKWGWIDFVSAIPFFQFFRVGRLMMVFEIIRLFRGIRSVKTIVEFIFMNRSKGILASVGMISFVMIVFSSITILSLEKDTFGANIKTPESALWWAITTVTTVGYGDHYPVTTLGRIVAAGLMITGVALFGTFTAYVASVFFKTESDVEKAIENEILKEIKLMRKELDDIKKKLGDGK